MGTTFTVTLPAWDVAAAEAVFTEVARIEALVSTWRAESELSRLNAASGPTRVTPELFDITERALALRDQTGGAFNPAVAPLLRLWRTREDGAVPSAESIAAAVSQVNRSRISLDRAAHAIDLGGAVLEEGAYAKGYAIDRAIETLRSRGVDEAVIDFGGQLFVAGGATQVAVAHPNQRDVAALRFAFGNQSLSTSAGTEKTFTVDGRTFTHIFDPRSGEALEPRGSVSVLSRSAFEADALSTALYVMGPREGFRWAEEHRVAALFLIPDGDRFVIKTTTAFDHAVTRVTAIHPQGSLDERISLTQ